MRFDNQAATDHYHSDFPVFAYVPPKPFLWSRPGWSILGHGLLALPLGYLMSPWFVVGVFLGRETATLKNGMPWWHRTLEVLVPALVGWWASSWR